MSEHDQRPRGALAQLSGQRAVAAAAPALFAPMGALLVALYDAPIWSLIAIVLGAAPLTAVAGVAASKSLRTHSFAWACIPLALVAAWMAWLSGGALSPAAPWAFVAIAAIALLGGGPGALVATFLVCLIGAGLLLAPTPPIHLLGFAPRGDRELIAVISWSVAAASIAFLGWAVVTAWTNALPPLSHPTIAARHALSLVFQASDVCALRIDSNEQVTQVLGADDQTLGIPRDVLRAAPLSQLTHPDDVPALHRLMKAALAPAPPMARPQVNDAARPTVGEDDQERTAALRLRSGYGGYRWLEATVISAANFPAPPKTAVTKQDVVLVLRARWRPDQDIDMSANPERAAFLAQMNNALRGGLKSIVGYMDAINSELFGPLGAERYRDFARRAHERGEELLELIDELMDMAAMEAGQYAGQTEMVDPAPLIDGALRRVRARAERGGVTLKTELSPNTPPIRADRRALRRAIVNIMLDAIHRGAVGDEAKMSVSVEEGAVRFKLLTTPGGGPQISDMNTNADEFGGVPTAPDPDEAEISVKLSEARLGRMVATSLIERMGGAVYFAGGVEFEDGDVATRRGYTGESDTLYAEALLPVPRASSTEEEPLEIDTTAPKQAQKRSAERRKIDAQEELRRWREAEAELQEVEEIDRPLFAPPDQPQREPAANVATSDNAVISKDKPER